jgi:1,2-phenylacetyl-CoA epoxidase PaaB subunit
LGDAEQIVACFYTENSIEPTVGSIDAPTLQVAIVSIMEGGSEAFQRRKEIYEIWNVELLEIAARGEDSRHQFKADFTNAASMAAEIVALANSDGGKS